MNHLKKLEANELYTQTEFDHMLSRAAEIIGIKHLPIAQQRENIAVILAHNGMSLPEYVALHEAMLID